MNSKAMSLAIQTFIILFVSIAVAMLVLQLVSKYFNQNPAMPIITGTEAQIRRAQIESECQKLCSKAQEYQTMAYEAEYCVKKFRPEELYGKGLDIDNDGKYGFAPDLGWGFCEDTIYCWNVTHCYVNGEELNPRKCKEILCKFLSQQHGAAYANAKINDILIPGDCYKNLSDKQEHWYGLLAGPSGNIQCS